MRVAGIGIDLCPVARVERVLARSGRRFLERVYTPAECRYCLGRARPAESLAARVAAKEAASKALGAPAGIGWHDVEVVAAVEGARGPGVRLAGVAARVARERGVAQILLSLTHAGGVAAAVAVAVVAGAEGA
jgi:holo-[acyl-carrier protein] synthase